MKDINQKLALPTLTAVIMMLNMNHAIAAEEDEDDPIKALTKPSSSIEIGVGNWSGDREQFGIYDGIQDDETILLLDVDYNSRNEETGTWFTWKLEDFGMDTREAELNYERQGNWGIGFEYDEKIRTSPYTVNTAMTGLGTETQIVPFGGSGYVPGTGADITLETQREKIGINGYKYLSKNLRLKVDFKSEDKDGDRHWGRGDEPEFAAEPIDSNIKQLEATLDYSGKEYQLSGGYYGSWYTNDNDLVFTWGDDGGNNRVAYLSVPLDNEAHQFFVNGGYNFTPTTRGYFRLSYTHATQDEHIPTSSLPDGRPFNAAYFPQSALAPSKLDGELNTTVVKLGVTARPTTNLSLIADLNYHDVDDDTPRWQVNDSPTHGTPLDYETLTGKLEGTYRFTNGINLIAGFDIRNQDRNVPFGNLDANGFDDERYVPFRDEVDEKTYRIQLRKTMTESVSGALTYAYSERDGSSYADAIHSFDPTDPDPEPPAIIDPVNIADRDRDKIKASIDWYPTERLNLQFNYEIMDDDYSGNTFGLRDGKAQLFSVDGSVLLNDDWQMTAWYSYDKNEARQSNWRDANNNSGSNFSEANLFSTLTDEGDTFGASLEGNINPKLKVGVDLEWTETRSEYDQNIVPVDAAGTGSNTGNNLLYPDTAILPDIKSTSSIIRLFAEYAMDKHSDLRFDLIHERWKTDDWTWNFSDGTPFIYTGRNDSDGTMVIQDPNQSSTFIGVSYRYKFN